MKCPGGCAVEFEVSKETLDAHLREAHRLVECCPVCSSIDIRTEIEVPWTCDACCAADASDVEEMEDVRTRRRATSVKFAARCPDHVPRFERRCRMCGWADESGIEVLPLIHVLTREVVPVPVEFVPDRVCPGDFDVRVNGAHVAAACTHQPGVWRLGFDWGQGLALLDTKAEVEAWARRVVARRESRRAPGLAED
jgi:hypothetical protein